MDIVYYILIFLLSYLLPFAGISKLFEKAGEASWKAYIPILNFVVWCKITGRPVWHVALLFVPIVGIFVLANMACDLNKTFSRFSFGDNVMAIALPFIWFPYLGFNQKLALQQMGPAYKIKTDFRKKYREAAKAKDEKLMRQLEKENPIPKKGMVREWADSIIFAVFAAHFIRLFLIEAYTIPTPSMEGSLLVGDFLFVSKVHYGSRLPMTPVSFPLLHNVFPITGTECYTKWPKWGYLRAPALQKVERYDPVVFNYPEGDTTLKTKDYGQDYHNILKAQAPEKREQIRQSILASSKSRLAIRPVDKRDHYIKRCVGIPGDSIEVIGGILYVNGQEAPKITGVQNEYRLIPNQGKHIIASNIESRYNCTIAGMEADGSLRLFTNVDEAARMKSEMTDLLSNVALFAAEKEENSGSIFPYNHTKYRWNNDFYGPIWIPKKGTSVQLSMNNIELYQRIITAYEGNTLEIKNGQFFIDDKPATEYTFKMNYYWMMGDNRHNSADSRSWGFVPEDHIVGKPLFVWLSIGNKGIRWNRLFMSATKK